MDVVARSDSRQLLADTESRWTTRFGADDVGNVRKSRVCIVGDGAGAGSRSDRAPPRRIPGRKLMSADNERERETIAAGEFGDWVVEMQGAIRGEQDSDVPCDGCTACCTSAQFVHIAPDETDTLAHIPRELLFPAPRMPRGHMLLGYDERGHCPMLDEGVCTIYDHRPRTCRTYDCRIFSAAGVEVDDGDDAKSAIAQRTRRWQFTFAAEEDHLRHAAVEVAAAFLAGREDLCPGGARPSLTGLAVLAVAVHDLFLRCDAETGEITLVEPDLALLRDAVGRASLDDD